MRSAQWASIIRTAGVGVLGAAVVWCAWETPRDLPATVVACPEWRRSPLSPAAAALRRARWTRLRAQRAADEDRYAMEAWDPAGTAGADFEDWRLQLLAGDRTGDLARARKQALQAADLAQSEADIAMAEELLVLIEHERGDHAAELERARRLATLPAGSGRGRPLLRRALGCAHRH